MRRRILLSALWGVALQFFFFILSSFVMRLFPYKDKPGAPNTFTWLLVPGLAVGEQLEGHRFLALAVAFSINTLIYAFVIFCLLSIINAVASANDRN